MICFASPLPSFSKRCFRSTYHDYWAITRARRGRALGLRAVRCISEGELLRMKPLELRKLYSEGSVPSSFREGDYSGTMLLFSRVTYLSLIMSWLIRAFIWNGKRYSETGGTFINKWGPCGKILAIELKPRFVAGTTGGAECVELKYRDTLPYPFSRVRDEVRAIAPGQYLGIMYVSRVMLGYFHLRLETVD